MVEEDVLLKRAEKAGEIITGAAKMSSERSDLLMSVADKLRREGKREGKEEGKKEAAFNMVVKQIEKKLDSTISEDLKKELEEADHETLERVGENIFQIEDEQDIRDLL